MQPTTSPSIKKTYAKHNHHRHGILFSSPASPCRKVNRSGSPSRANWWSTAMSRKTWTQSKLFISSQIRPRRPTNKTTHKLLHTHIRREKAACQSFPSVFQNKTDLLHTISHTLRRRYHFPFIYEYTSPPQLHDFSKCSHCDATQQAIWASVPFTLHITDW